MPSGDLAGSGMLKSEAQLDELFQKELDRFVQARPRSMALHARGAASMPHSVPMAWMHSFYEHPAMFVAEGSGAYFTDVDGHRYLDMNQADMSMSAGYGPEPVVTALCEQLARGTQFLLPTEEAVHVSESLAERFGLPAWQFTLSASAANTEAIRIARCATGRSTVLMFHGSYHGMIEDWLSAEDSQEVTPGRRENTVLVHYNAIEAVEQAFREHDIAAVVIEPALTNVNVVLPQKGFHERLAALCREHGAVLIHDETHTHVCAFGGLTREWGCSPDMLVLGKSIASGIPMGAYGMRRELADVVEANIRIESWLDDDGGLSLGGTLFGNAFSMRAAAVTLNEILTESNQARAADLGGQLSDGIEEIIARHDLPWSAHRLFCRSGVCYAPTLPTNAIEAAAAGRTELIRFHRIFLANRGVWEAIFSAGPCVSLAASREDVDLYLQVFDELLREITT